MCFALKAPNPILIVLWTHLPACEGDGFKAKQLVQQDSIARGELLEGPRLLFFPFPVRRIHKSKQYCIVVFFIGY